MKGLLKRLGKVEVRFCWLGRNRRVKEKNRIKINIYLFVVEAFVHGYYHRKFWNDSYPPNVEEKLVEIQTQRKMQKLTSSQIVYLAKRIMQKGGLRYEEK